MSSPSTPSPSSPGPSKEPSKSLEESKDTATPSSESSEENTSTTQEPAQTSETTPSNTTTSEVNSPTSNQSPSPNPWQAIYSPQYNAYYFFNTETNETTWQNPLQPAGTPDASTSTSTTQPAGDAPTSTSAAEVPTGSESAANSSSSSSYNALQAAAIAQGIDPSLAYLDPSLAGGPSSSGLGAYGATAKFNARTGQFTRVDARDPSHLSEYERAKRMSEFYFDVNAWEAQRAEDQEAEATQGGDKKRKRPSKKDLERFKEQKRQKKIAKTAWLRT